jgi:hypothetical protein
MVTFLKQFISFFGALWSKSMKKHIFFKTLFGFSKMDKNKCPKSKTKCTFWKNILRFLDFVFFV